MTDMQDGCTHSVTESNMEYLV